MNERELEEVARRITILSRQLVDDVLTSVLTAIVKAKKQLNMSQTYERGVAQGFDLSMDLINAAMHGADKAIDSMKEKVE